MKNKAKGIKANTAASGQVSGKHGKYVVYNALTEASRSFDEKADSLRDTKEDREAVFKRSRDDLEAAVRAAAGNDTKLFETLAGKAEAELTDALSLHYDVSDVGLGLDLAHAKEPISRALRDIGAVAKRARERVANVEIPDYRHLDAKRAILAEPGMPPAVLRFFTVSVGARNHRGPCSQTERIPARIS